MKTKTKKASQSANAVYQKLLGNVNERIEVLKVLVAKHAETQAKRPQNWGYVGDLSHLLQLLDETCMAVDGLSDGSEGWAFNAEGERVRVSIPKDED